jgi:hypothetical protein
MRASDVPFEIVKEDEIEELIEKCLSFSSDVHCRALTASTGLGYDITNVIQHLLAHLRGRRRKFQRAIVDAIVRLAKIRKLPSFTFCRRRLFAFCKAEYQSAVCNAVPQLLKLLDDKDKRVATASVDVIKSLAVDGDFSM